MSTPDTARIRPRALATGPAPAMTTTGAVGRVIGFARRDVVRTVRMLDSTFFILVLPAAMYLMFGTAADASGQPLGDGNVTAHVMSGMALYGAITATTAIAGTAAVERQAGWGRQLSLTALTSRGYMLGKTLVAVAVSALPILLVLTVGALTGAEYDEAWRWAATGAIALICAAPFALFGLAAALLFRSEAAVSAASGMLVVFAFLGNLFVPLTGTLLEVARFTPIYGAALLTRWPQSQGAQLNLDHPMTPLQTPLWQPVASLTVWAVVFAVVCLLASRRRTARA